MCKSSSASTNVSLSTPRRRGGERGSWYHFLTSSFHGMLGMTSFMVTLSAWIHNNHVANIDVRSASSLILPIVSVILTTILSIHSSWYMLEQSPHQSTILDYKLRLKQRIINFESINIKVVAPHRGAFHRTSIIMQYANARILMLLQRRHLHQQQVASSALASSLLTSESPSPSSVIVWALVSFTCLRMLPIPDVSKIIFTDTKRQTISSSASDKTSRKLPRFWSNGNSYCFVLPMIISLVADFCMAAWCEYHYYNYYIKSQQNGFSSSQSLFQYHSHYWLSLWHLFFLQIVAHTIAFGFTLAFRLKSSNRSKKNIDEIDKNAKNYGTVGYFQYIKGTRLFDIRTLYWTCTIGVYALAMVGFTKATATLKALKM